MTLEQIRALQAAGDDAGALRALERLDPAEHERPQAAALALALGRPRLAAAWAAESDAQLHAAALLRLGEGQAVLELLKGQPESEPSAQPAPPARVALLRARALGTLESAALARTLARQEGDSPALIAAATLMGELLLPDDPRAALLALAEGLKVSEMMREDTDALLLAVLSAVQARVGGPAKATRTAQKALERSLPRSPARVIALLVLGRGQEAEAERLGGELASNFQVFLNVQPE